MTQAHNPHNPHQGKKIMTARIQYEVALSGLELHNLSKDIYEELLPEIVREALDLIVGNGLSREDNPNWRLMTFGRTYSNSNPLFTYGVGTPEEVVPTGEWGSIKVEVWEGRWMLAEGYEQEYDPEKGI